MERPTWVARPTIKRADTPKWEPKRIGPFNHQGDNHMTMVREEMAHELYGRFGNPRTIHRFVERIRNQEGLGESR